jgi:hypothetical protein
LISVASIGSWANSEQVSPWDPKTQFHGFVPALVGVYLPQTQSAIFEKISVLPPARDEKNLWFFLLPHRADCAAFSAPTLARAWGTAIPIEFVDAAKARFKLLAATAKLALCFCQYCFHNRTQKSSE